MLCATKAKAKKRLPLQTGFYNTGQTAFDGWAHTMLRETLGRFVAKTSVTTAPVKLGFGLRLLPVDTCPPHSLTHPR